MEYNELTEAQKAKVEECKTADELMALVCEEGIELTDEQLAAVSGGVKGWDEPPNCYYCGSDNTEFTGQGVKCNNCGAIISGLLG